MFTFTKVLKCCVGECTLTTYLYFTVHVSPIKRLLAIYFATETAKCCQIRAVCYPLQSAVSTHTQKAFPIDNQALITPSAMDVHTRHVNGSRNGYI